MGFTAGVGGGLDGVQRGGGGGGGYSGGGGGGFGSAPNGAPIGYGGGGGGSIAVGFQESELFAGVNSGNGFINITIVPEPSTWATMLAGFAGLGWLARQRQRQRKLGPA
jgi:hypothetical protein